MQPDFDVDFDDGCWPDLSDPHMVWLEFAVSRGVKRTIAQGMSKAALIKSLDRMESDDE